MRLLSALGLVGILFSASVGWAAPAIRSTPSDRPEDHPQVRVVSSDAEGLSLIFELPALTVEEITNGTDTYQLVTIPGGALEGELGAPALPTYSRLVMIPDDAAVSVEAVVEAEEDLGGYRIVPMQADEP